MRLILYVSYICKLLTDGCLTGCKYGTITTCGRFTCGCDCHTGYVGICCEIGTYCFKAQT